MPGRGVLTLGDNLPNHGGSTWRRGYERAAASSARDKDRPLSLPFSGLRVPPPPSAARPSLLGRSAAPSPAVRLGCHPRPRVFTLHFSLIARFCKLVSISLLHLLPFTVFARSCGKRRGAQQKANPLTAQEGNAPAAGCRRGTFSPAHGRSCCWLPREVTQAAKIKQPFSVSLRWDEADYTGLANY